LATNTNKHQLKGTSSEEDQVIPVMLAVQHGLSESPMLWGEEIDRMCSIELQKRGAPHGHFAIIFVDDTSVGVTQRDDKQLEELQKKGAPHEHFALIIVDDTDMDGVTLQHKQLEELGASFREYKTEHLALIFVDDSIDPASTPITTALRPRRLAWQSQLKIRRLSKGSKKTQQLLSPACLLLSQLKACSKMRLKMVEKSQQATLLLGLGFTHGFFQQMSCIKSATTN
jgi:hypothetical protein